MTNDLVKRLRSDAHMIQADGLGAMLGTAAEAADRIEALTAEIERLREICSLLDKALLAAFPYGAFGEAWVLWNDARKALTRKETAETFTRSDNV